MKHLVTVAAIIAFAALYLWGYSERHPWWVLAGMLALMVVTVPVLGVGSCGLLPYVATHAALELPRDTRVIRLTRPQPVREIVVLTRATVAHRPVVRRAVELLLQRTPHD